VRQIESVSSIFAQPKKHRQPNFAGSKSIHDSDVQRDSDELHAKSPITIHVRESVDWRIKKILLFIDSEDGKIGSDMADICRQLNLGISADYATKLFRKETGIGFREYGAHKRLMKAAVQLAETNLSIKVIAADLGYNIPQTFSRRFKFQYQVKPTEYRRQQHT
jgi:AraC-like DNA-binding protein